VSEPYRGCRVADISLQDAYGTYQIEAVLEGFAAFLATNFITDVGIKKLEDLINESKKIEPQQVERWEEYNRQIHKVIIQSSRNKRLMDIIRNNVKFSNYWFIVLSSPGQIPKMNHEHELILESIKERDAEKVRRLVEDHIMKAAEDITKRIEDLFPIIKNSKETVV
jgi:DNA-binding GntR family transcriptional regulator